MKREPAPAVAKKLAKLGLRSADDLALHLPHRYEDETRLTPPEAAPAGTPVLVEGKVLNAEVKYRPKRQLVVHAEGLVLRFLNFYGSQLKQFQRAADEGGLVRAYGEVRPGFFGAEMIHPRYRVVPPGEPLPQALTPIYPTTAGLSQYALRKLVLQALDEAVLDDTLPDAMRRRYGLSGIAESVRSLHRPAPDAPTAELLERSSAEWRRVKFDELLAQQLSMRMAYRARRARAAPALPSNGPLLKRFLGRLPFRLTRAQRRAMAEILHDLGEPHPMQRLLQGDVGSGKTIVAAIACLAALDAGCQAAVMAPTEILAEQHLRKFSEWLAPLGVPIAWLHGGLSAAEKNAVVKRLRDPAPVLAIGTHALFQKKVGFSRLALAIVDEQHRFGVQQRLALRRKGETRSADTAPVPHQLMMSATPIPRTLSMSYYADLDISTIDELPPGRRGVLTKLFADDKRAEVLARIREACAEGQQAYWVCPVIEESRDELQTAVDTFEQLRVELKGLRVGLLHGRLPAERKAAVMKAFVAGKLNLLVATTVIEVGVDVPNASLMVIEHAERFGLAQLHQLRGRIGRASGKNARESACILLYAAPLSDTARTRLKVIFKNSDGFEIARQDLKLRGPGEYLGERQSGAPLLRYADLEKDEPLARQAREAADILLEKDPRAARRHVERWLASRHENARA
ncbi:MAG TPA: ATP-dependent DNA helicase RecG [Burkholderiales bacterium]|nr:ATP-dependent DNA helicase RecG [Burkholderiales bacterium]